MSLYLILNIASFIVPFLYSFEKKMRFIKHWKSVFTAIFITAFFFIVWDIVFTKQGVWGFNGDYLLGVHFFGLPLEEILFFICIPYASIFMHYVFIHFYPTKKISYKLTKIITILLLTLLLMVLFFNFEKAYTAVNYIVLIMLLSYTLLTDITILQQFYITFLTILIPFFIVNGILTGSYIEAPIVWYNNNENLGIRLTTIPVEDIAYAFSMLYASIIMIEKFKPIFKNE